MVSTTRTRPLVLVHRSSEGTTPGSRCPAAATGRTGSAGGRAGRGCDFSARTSRPLRRRAPARSARPRRAGRAPPPPGPAPPRAVLGAGCRLRRWATSIELRGARRENRPVPEHHRLAQLDAVRTALVFAVVVFHGLRVFDAFDFYVKGPEVDALAPVILLGGLAGMPLFFVLAGVSLWHSMGRRSPTALARERSRRLGIPFVVAVVVLVPPQIHAQRMQDGTAGSYWDTLHDFFQVRLTTHFPIPVDGQAASPFGPAHVWFLAYLLAFTLVLLPVLWPLRRDAARGAALARTAGRRPGLLVAMLAGAGVQAVHASEDAGGWSRWAYPLFLVLGFLLAADPSAARGG